MSPLTIAILVIGIFLCFFGRKLYKFELLAIGILGGLAVAFALGLWLEAGMQTDVVVLLTDIFNAASPIDELASSVTEIWALQSWITWLTLAVAVLGTMLLGSLFFRLHKLFLPLLFGGALFYITYVVSPDLLTGMFTGGAADFYAQYGLWVQIGIALVFALIVLLFQKWVLILVTSVVGAFLVGQAVMPGGTGVVSVDRFTEVVTAPFANVGSIVALVAFVLSLAWQIFFNWKRTKYI